MRAARATRIEIVAGQASMIVLQLMVRFIEEHRDGYSVEPICAQVPIASSGYYEHKSRQADPTSASGRHRNLAAAGASLGCNAGRTLALTRHAGSLRTRTVRTRNAWARLRFGPIAVVGARAN